MKGDALQKLLDTMDKNDETWPQEVFIQISESQVGRAIRTKKWKYSVAAPVLNADLDGFLYSKSNSYIEEFLYDLENDIYEKNNLVGDPTLRDIRMGLGRILKRKMEEAGEDFPNILPKEV